MVVSDDTFLILHVDDDRSMLDLSATFLQHEDDRLEIDTALGAKDALEGLATTNYDAIISDYQMPGMDGLEFLEVIREDRGSDIPFIIFTGKGREEVAIDALNLGANRYLQKGGDPGAQYTVLADAVIQEVEHAQARANLQESEAKYRGVYENAPLAFVIWDQERTIVDWNERAVELFGWSRDEAIGADALTLLVPDDKRADLAPVFDSLLEDMVPNEHVNQNVTADGEQIWCHWYNAPLEDSEGTVGKVMSLALDITDTREQQAQLQQYATTIESSDDSIYMLDTEGRYQFANQEHLVRLVADGKIDQAHEDAVIGEQYATIHSDAEAERLAPLLEDVLETGEPRTEEYEFLTEEKWSYRTYSPVTDPTREAVTGVVVISKDVTKQKQAENREAFLNSLLRHDLRNKIQIAHGYHDLLAEATDSTEATEYLEAASDTLSEGIDLIEKISLLSKLETKEIGTDDRSLQSVLENVVSAKRAHATDEGITLTCDRCEGIVQAGPLLEEVFSNVIENAIIHADAERIHVSVTETSDAFVVHVADDGVGIPDEQRTTLLERGVTDGDTAGSGLGLYLVDQIAESYGGSVSIETAELGGTRIDIRLPKSARTR